MDRRSKRAAAIAAVVGAVLALHARVVGFGFVYDDHFTILDNRALFGPLRPLLAASIGGRARALGIPDATRPVMIASTWIDAHLFGTARPWGFHLHSLLLHAAACALAFLLLRALLRPIGALVAALFFAAAPLHGEVVASINYREDLLAGGFVLLVLVLLFYPRFRAASVGVAAAVAVSTALACLAKESAVVLPALIAAIAALRGEPLRDFLRRNERPLLALSAVLVVYLNWRLGLGPADDVPRSAQPFGARLLATARYEVLAVAHAFVPFGWTPERAPLPRASPLFVAAFVSIVALAVALSRRATTRTYALAIAIALLAPLASSPLVGPGNELADRYFYLAILGGAMAWGAAFERASRAPRVAIAALLVACAFESHRAISAFRSDLDLFRVASERAPASPRAWVGLSRALRIAGDLDGADAAVARALSLDPSYPPARLTRAYNLLARGRVEEARSVLETLHGLPGLPRARSCARLAPEEARRCIVTPRAP